jgi:Bacterial tandem repeat domain 1
MCSLTPGLMANDSSFPTANARQCMARRHSQWHLYLVLATLIAILALPRSTIAGRPVATSDFEFELAYRWAPIHFQDTDSSDYDADYISAIDFDGDWETSNNWEHQDDNLSHLQAKVYFSVVETSTHWYLLYGFYHPRDWSDALISSQHENDMEEILLIVRKDGSTYGTLEGMVTVAHEDFYSFVPPGSPLQAGQESIDGSVEWESYDGFDHPMTFQEAKGHGIKTWQGVNPGEDGVKYYPSRFAAEVPSHGDDRYTRYRLVNIFEYGGLWDHRYDPLTFHEWGTFRGGDGQDNAANAPWGSDDHNDGRALLRGELATDPALLTAIYFSNLGDHSRAYIRNAYRCITPPLYSAVWRPALYAAVWRPGTEEEIQVYGRTYEDFRAKYDELWPQGWRLHILQAYVLNGEVRYSAVWRPSVEDEIQVYGRTYEDFRAKYDELWPQGWRLHILQAYVQNGAVRYSAVWRPSTEEEIQVYGWTYEDFRAKYDELWPQGWRLQALMTY